MIGDWRVIISRTRLDVAGRFGYSVHMHTYCDYFKLHLLSVSLSVCQSPRITWSERSSIVDQKPRVVVVWWLGYLQGILFCNVYRTHTYVRFVLWNVGRDFDYKFAFHVHAKNRPRRRRGSKKILFMRQVFVFLFQSQSVCGKYLSTFTGSTNIQLKENELKELK